MQYQFYKYYLTMIQVDLFYFKVVKSKWHNEKHAVDSNEWLIIWLSAVPWQQYPGPTFTNMA